MQNSDLGGKVIGQPNALLQAQFAMDHVERRAGLLEGVGYKFGRWTDTLLMQRMLGDGASQPPPPDSTPSDPPPARPE